MAISQPKKEVIPAQPRGSEVQRNRVLYFHAGDSRYDEFFIEELGKDFEMEYATLNPHPSIELPNSAPIVFSQLLGFLYGRKFTRGLIQFASVRPVRSLIKKMKPDAIIGCYATTYGYLCAKSNFSPNILFVFGSDVLIDPKNPILESFVRTALKRADLILLDSIVQENAALRLGADKGRVLRIPWVDAEALAALRPSSMSLRKKLNWQDATIIFCPRKHEKIYQVDKVIVAFGEIHKQNPSTRLILAGAGSQSERLKQQVSSLGLDQQVFFTGNLAREQLISVYDESDVYVSASVSDGTSASLIEAMARRVPAVVSDIEGNREWIDNGRNGFLFDLDSPKQMIDMMLEAILLSPESKRSLTGAAFRTVMERARWSQNRIKLIDALNGLMLKQPNGR